MRLFPLMRKFFNTSKFYMDLESKYGCHNYHPLPVVISKGKGIHLYDTLDRKYIDFLSAYSAVNQGHCHPEIYKSMKNQMKKLTLTSRAFYNDQLGKTEELLSQTFNYDKVLLMNSGVEAGESAIKLARRWAYESKKIPDDQAKVLFAKGNFWGRTIAACGSSDDPERYMHFGPFGGLGFELVEYDNIEALEQRFKNDKNIAAYMLEPIQGERGVYIPKEGYLKNVRELCTKYNVLMIADEIQTGLGRTGKMLACDWEQIRPDIVLLGKALTGGFYPVSAVLCDNFIMDLIKPGQHGSTYGGNPLGCAVVQKAIEVILHAKCSGSKHPINLCNNSEKMGNILLDGLKKLDKPFIKVARGKGLMCALEMKEDFKTSAWDICIEMMKRGLLAKPTHNNIIRLAPPLIINEKEINKSLEIIHESLNEFK